MFHLHKCILYIRVCTVYMLKMIKNNDSYPPNSLCIRWLCVHTSKKNQSEAILNPCTHTRTDTLTCCCTSAALPGCVCVCVCVTVGGVIVDFQLQLSEQTVGKSAREYGLLAGAETLQLNINNILALSPSPLGAVVIVIQPVITLQMYCKNISWPYCQAWGLELCQIHIYIY